MVLHVQYASSVHYKNRHDGILRKLSYSWLNAIFSRTFRNSIWALKKLLPEKKSFRFSTLIRSYDDRAKLPSLSFDYTGWQRFYWHKTNHPTDISCNIYFIGDERISWTAMLNHIFINTNLLNLFQTPGSTRSKTEDPIKLYRDLILLIGCTFSGFFAFVPVYLFNLIGVSTNLQVT